MEHPACIHVPMEPTPQTSTHVRHAMDVKLATSTLLHVHLVKREINYTTEHATLTVPPVPQWKMQPEKTVWIVVYPAAHVVVQLAHV